MTVSADTLALLIAAGLSGDRLIEVVRSMEADTAAVPAPTRSSGAERQRRWRERNAASVSGDVTRDASPRDADPLPLPPSPQPPQPPTPAPGVCSTRGREAAAKLEGFESFWAAYPRKVAKPAALKAYAKALRRLTDPDGPGVILAGLRRHLPAWEDTEPDLVPHPTTWLNQDRFHDEPTPPRNPMPRLIHDRDRPHQDRRATAYAERLQDVGAASAAAARDWRPPGGH